MNWTSIGSQQGEYQGAWEDSDGGDDAGDVHVDEDQVCTRQRVWLSSFST